MYMLRGGKSSAHRNEINHKTPRTKKAYGTYQNRKKKLSGGGGGGAGREIGMSEEGTLGSGEDGTIKNLLFLTFIGRAVLVDRRLLQLFAKKTRLLSKIPHC